MALVLVSLLGVLLANALSQFVPASMIKKVAGAGFIGMGLLMLLNKL